MKRILIIFLLLANALNGNTQNYNPTKGVNFGGAIGFNGKLSAGVNLSAYYFDLMWTCEIVNGEKSKGIKGEDYTNVLGRNYMGYIVPWEPDAFAGCYQTEPFNHTLYAGIILDRFAIGGIIHFRQYETGRTFYDEYHILSSNGYYSIVGEYHNEYKFGVYAKFFTTKYTQLFLTYLFEDEPRVGIGLTITPFSYNQTNSEYKENNYRFGVGITTHIFATNKLISRTQLNINCEWKHYDLGIGFSCDVYGHYGIYQGYKFNNGLTLGLYGGVSYIAFGYDEVNPTITIEPCADFGIFGKYEITDHWKLVSEFTYRNKLGIGIEYNFN